MEPGGEGGRQAGRQAGAGVRREAASELAAGRSRVWQSLDTGDPAAGPPRPAGGTWVGGGKGEGSRWPGAGHRSGQLSYGILVRGPPHLLFH